ncbi:NADH/ubiquinone/plastoquinone (complex I) [bacterium]|nr:NADH/ubiquinone/plastoquinone (complex I) [bacterium]
MSLLLYFIIVPLGGAFLLPIISRLRESLSDWVGNAITALLLYCSVYGVITASGKTVTYFVGGWRPIADIPVGINLVMDGLSGLMLLIVNIVALLVTLYSVNYMARYTDKGKYYTLFLLMVAGLNGVILSGDLFNLFVFLEITAIASYALVAFGIEDEELEASFKYQVLGGTASALILLGIAVFYQTTGTLNLADASRVIAGIGHTPTVLFAGVLFMAGFCLKAALIPFHAWLPDAHPAAPAPISAMLSGVVIKVLGVYPLCRLFFNVYGITPLIQDIFMVLGVVSIILGVFLALSQWDFKRLLAYHSISQIGYVVLGIGLGTPLGILGGLFHLINHSVFKSLLFLNAGSVVYATDTRELKELGGLQRKMPVTGATSQVASFSIAGLPPFNGFWSKLIIIVACVQAGQMLFAVLAVIGSILTLLSFLKVQRYVFFDALKEKWKNVREVPFLMCVSMIVFALLCIGMGLLLLPQISAVTLKPAADVLYTGLEYATKVLGG